MRGTFIHSKNAVLIRVALEINSILESIYVTVIISFGRQPRTMKSGVLPLPLGLTQYRLLIC